MGKIPEVPGKVTVGGSLILDFFNIKKSNNPKGLDVHGWVGEGPFRTIVLVEKNGFSTQRQRLTPT